MSIWTNSRSSLLAWRTAFTRFPYVLQEYLVDEVVEILAAGTLYPSQFIQNISTHGYS